jgi:hypothetical protein
MASNINADNGVVSGSAGLKTSADSTGVLALQTNGTTAVTINTTGTVILQGGNTSANGIGVAFPATQSASTDANCLDDYEEGTWTPNQGSGLTIVGTFGSQGFYTKIGNLVTISGYVGASTSVIASTGSILCTNAPFASASALLLWSGSVINWNADSGASCGVPQGSTTVYNGTAVTTSIRISFCVTYRV